MKRILLPAIALLLASFPGAARAVIIGADDGTILTVTGNDELVIRDIGTDSNTVLDDDFDWQKGGSGEYRSIASYSGDGSPDTGSIITIGNNNLILVDLSTGDEITLDNDITWTTGDGYRGIAAYTGDGTADDGTIVATTNGGNLILIDLLTNSTTVIDDDRNWSGSGEHAGIAAYTGDGTADNGTILYSTDGGLYLRDLSADTSTLLDDDLNWGSNQRRGIAAHVPASVPEPTAAALATLGMIGLAVTGSRRAAHR